MKKILNLVLNALPLEILMQQLRQFLKDVAQVMLLIVFMDQDIEGMNSII